MANLVPKVPAEQWVAAARRTLIDEGIDAVKVDRLAKRLGVSRGGFYHHFADRSELLERLLENWALTVEFVPAQLAPETAAQALAAIDAIVAQLVAEERYDPSFDMAMRAWAHADPAIDQAVQQSDRARLASIQRIFLALGCDTEESLVRARVFYFHQIGYYVTGLKETRSQRASHIQTYLRILCGEHHLERARHDHGKAPAGG